MHPCAHACLAGPSGKLTPCSVCCLGACCARMDMQFHARRAGRLLLLLTCIREKSLCVLSCGLLTGSSWPSLWRLCGVSSCCVVLSRVSVFTCQMAFCMLLQNALYAFMSGQLQSQFVSYTGVGLPHLSVHSHACHNFMCTVLCSF